MMADDGSPMGSVSRQLAAFEGLTSAQRRFLAARQATRIDQIESSTRAAATNTLSACVFPAG